MIMDVKTNRFNNPSAVDRKANDSAVRIANKYGLRDRAKSTWHAMADELMSDVAPAMEEQATAQANEAAKGRLRDIMALPEAAERRDLAERLALETDSSADQVKAILASAPKARAYKDPLAKLMAGLSPGINSDIGDDDEMNAAEESERAAKMILNAGK